MYYVKSFGGLTLQTEKNISQPDDIGASMAINRYLQTPNGWYDINEARLAKRNVNYVQAQRLLHSQSASGLRTMVEDWRAKIGERGVLTVEWWDGTERWVYARLDSVHTPAYVGDIASATAILTWSTIEQSWRAAALTSVTRSVAGKATDLWTVNNPGDLTVYDVTATFVTGGNMNEPTLENNDTGHGFWYEAVATGTMIVNAGAKTINKTYDFLSPNNRNIWFSLRPGNNEIRFVLDSGTGNSGASVKIDFYARYG